MRLSAPLRAAIVVALAWLVLIFATQIMGSGRATPEGTSAASYWGLMGFIGVLLGGLAYAVTALVILMTGINKKHRRR